MSDFKFNNQTHEWINIDYFVTIRISNIEDRIIVQATCKDKEFYNISEHNSMDDAKEWLYYFLKGKVRA